MFNTNLNNSRTNTNTNIGFRSALLLRRDRTLTSRGRAQRVTPKGRNSLPKIEVFREKIVSPWKRRRDGGAEMSHTAERQEDL